MVSVYHLQINKMIKYDSKLIINIFLKISDKRFTNWVRNLFTIL